MVISHIAGKQAFAIIDAVDKATAPRDGLVETSSYEPADGLRILARMILRAHSAALRRQCPVGRSPQPEESTEDLP